MRDKSKAKNPDNVITRKSAPVCTGVKKKRGPLPDNSFIVSFLSDQIEQLMERKKKIKGKTALMRIKTVLRYLIEEKKNLIAQKPCWKTPKMEKLRISLMPQI